MVRMYSKLHLTIGNKEVNVQLNGMDRINQIRTMKSILDGFIDELEREVVLEEQTTIEALEEKAAIEARQMIEVANTLGMDEDKFAQMACAYAKLDPNSMERKLLKKKIEAEKQKSIVLDQTKHEITTTVEKDRGRTKYNTTISSLLKHQTYYICPDCRNKGKHYVTQGTPFVNCHSCGLEMTLKAAAPGPFPHQDEYGNSYIAGKFIRADKYEPQYTTLADKEKREEEEAKMASGH